ncbi:MAG: alpha/beta hydrolase, partial [Planctomycetes bacterium]|nr:alpha/beta hydrolase [Planctomycetota bacterium]
MADFVLVHGSGQSAASWSRVASVLSARGHTVAAPDLPKKAPDWRLEDYAAKIAESVRGPRAVVVAHSFSGAFLPLVPRIRDCARLVFFAAVIPEPGKSVRQQFTEDPSMFCPGWIEAGARWFDKSQAASLANEFLFHDCDAETLAWALTSIDLLDTRNVVSQPSPLTTWPSVP